MELLYILYLVLLFQVYKFGNKTETFSKRGMGGFHHIVGFLLISQKIQTI